MQNSENTAPNGWHPAGRCAIFVCDIASFGHGARHDRIQEHLRAALYEGLRRSFGGSGVSFDHCYREDRGDGVIIVPPSDIDPAVLVSPLVDRLRGELRRHNEISSDVARIRLRVSLHVGEVKYDGNGIVGVAVNHVNRLLDAPQFKEALNESGAHLGLIVSPELYETVIRPGQGLMDPGEYVRVEVEVKETRTTAWMRIPAAGRAVEPAGSRAVEPRKGDPPASAGRGRDVRATEHQVGLADLFEVVNMLLEVPIMATQDGRDQVVGSLRSEVAVRIPRRAQSNLDTHSIVRTCLDFPGGLGELLAVVKAFAGDSAQMGALEVTIERIVSRGQ